MLRAQVDICPQTVLSQMLSGVIDGVPLFAFAPLLDDEHDELVCCSDKSIFNLK